MKFAAIEVWVDFCRRFAVITDVLQICLVARENNCKRLDSVFVENKKVHQFIFKVETFQHKTTHQDAERAIATIL